METEKKREREWGAGVRRRREVTAEGGKEGGDWGDVGVGPA